ncbi:hypothetical protein X805_14770 [Sphaerotilus natans subsp. natans DSM 6575]|uniref:Uncharacterized protein n=1 Tax=Sphaerotilus natans subsp. natans DSM 6575 TaxID=1286631 RepID=A0A059KNY3_9BURK|nr:hypothetical protein X805_14770 [Sphaerotilus natans subsp. natans DSM 6575]
MLQHTAPCPDLVECPHRLIALSLAMPAIRRHGQSPARMSRGVCDDRSVGMKPIRSADKGQVSQVKTGHAKV